MGAPSTSHLSDDLAVLIERRRVLGWLAGLTSPAWSGALLSACGGGGGATTDSAAGSGTAAAGTTTGTGSSTTGTASSTTSGVTGCTTIPEETAGPYPGDGSNTSGGSVANALALSGIVRGDIRSSIGGATGVAAGIPLKVILRLVNVGNSCADLAGYAIYLWHCDREGRYSMYSTGITTENYLRGVQSTDASGMAMFTTIYPGCYDGRMPHMHFEVFRSVSTATGYTQRLRTSQLAFPNDVSTAVYATDAYSTSRTNFGRISFTTDNVFSDGVTSQLCTCTGSVAEGYVAQLTVGISA